MIYCIALVALLIVSSFIYLLCRRPDVGFALLLAVELADFALGFNGQLLGGIHLDPLDVISICLLVAGVFRTFQRARSITFPYFVAIGYVLLFALSLGRGIAANGFLAASNESRGFVGPLAATLYFATVPTDDKSIRRYIRAYLYFGAALCAVAVLAAAGLPLGMNQWSNADLAGIDGRYLPASAAAAIAVCGFFSLALLRRGGGGFAAKLIPVIYLCAAVYLRHRTVWVMLLVGAAALLFLDGWMFRRMLPVACVALIAVAALAVYGNNSDRLISESQFSDSATNTQTLEWRLNGWKELLFDDEQNAFTVTAGKSMGSGYWRVDPTSFQVTAVAPHSEYVQEYLRVGLVGALFIVLFAFRPLWQFWKLRHAEPESVYPAIPAWTVMALVTLVFGFTYGIQPHSYALIAIANAIVSDPNALAMRDQESFEAGWYQPELVGAAD
jgi:O-antigen ligase